MVRHVGCDDRKRKRTNKLRVIKIIEDDLQLLMKIYLGLRIASDHENGRRASKLFFSRKGCSIDSAL